jgi:hypothetical protein
MFEKSRTLPMSDEKEIVLTGAAAKSMDPSSYKRRSRTRKYRGGDNSGALTQLASQSAPADYKAPETQALAASAAQATAHALAQLGPTKITQTGGMAPGAIVNLASSRGPPVIPGSPEPIPVTSGVPVSLPAPVAGGAKLVLAPPKRKTRIALRAKKLGGSLSVPESLQLNPALPSELKGGTRKAKKLHLRVKGVTARLAKAKKAKKEASSASLSVIRSRLEKAGVIKKGSKAPEPMLRTMYADLLITKKGL